MASSSAQPIPDSVDTVLDLLSAHDYVADRALSTCVFLALRLGRPLFLEGEAGVGKTEIAKVLARALGRPLERLQCYEGLDLASAAYEWNYARQMIEIRLAEAAGAADRERLGRDIFTDAFLIRRPLLRAVEGVDGQVPVLLVDELDRADEPFEAFLLEVLSDFTITIPELGVRGGGAAPIVVVTSNRTREIHDALKRRCLYHWVDYPDAARERAILQAKAPGVGERLAAQVVAFVQGLRDQDLFKLPGVAETLDWANALMQLDVVELDPAVIDDTLGVLLKYQDDILRMRGSEAARILSQVKAELGHGTAA
ncbi:MoxR family ATPase [Roseospira marina]|uniref:MoxR family ATPase n=1 Tax=Roseospira marina TaxID=140057 RepID=A0A5M6IH48_9PROT|nr:MoxR family ATPase [Roseospira marina]KAA5607631.1 MoxR family ATPase [Roseospira marina]MBB4312169.1 MoxR-like ATPase [Roseospira marina]MBB5085815.1 MoxR-like ATPase [Roseospira marina]